MLYQSERRFKLWEYNVGHNQLLLRSPRPADSDEKNIDVIFLGVEYLAIPSALSGLKLRQASVKETAKVMGSLARVPDTCYIYSLLSQGRHYYVAAVAFRVFENDLDLFESSLESFSINRNSKAAGKLLVHS